MPFGFEPIDPKVVSSAALTMRQQFWLLVAVMASQGLAVTFFSWWRQRSETTTDGRN